MAKGDKEKNQKEQGALAPELGRVADALRQQFRAEMVRRGFSWHAGAASDLLAHVGAEGVSQATLPERLGVSKQAVQQLLDRLVEVGVVRREVRPNDARARWIALTEVGLADFAESQAVRLALEEAYRERLGDKGLRRFRKALRKLGDG